MTDQKVLVRHLQVFTEVASHVLRPVRSWEGDAWVPLTCLGPQKVLVDFILHSFFDLLDLLTHVGLCIEESMLGAVVNLSILDASDGFGSSSEAS
jgi:hypothetical protein